MPTKADLEAELAKLKAQLDSVQQPEPTEVPEPKPLALNQEQQKLLEIAQSSHEPDDVYIFLVSIGKTLADWEQWHFPNKEGWCYLYEGTTWEIKWRKKRIGRIYGLFQDPSKLNDGTRRMPPPATPFD